MKIERYVEFATDVEIEVGLDDIIEALGGETDTLNHVMGGLNNIASFLRAISDDLIATMNEHQRTTIRTFLQTQAARYEVRDDSRAGL